jgi:release factor glutamine methyltransferase
MSDAAEHRARADATVGELLAATAPLLAEAGIDEPRREARLLIALGLGVEPAHIMGYPERPVDAAARLRIEALVARRAAREPYSRIAGKRGFWSLDILLSPDTLDPRPASETLIESALERLADRSAPLSILDLGTGSGCLLLALLAELPNATGIGVDIATGAVRTARRNAAAAGLERRVSFLVGDWAHSIDTRADVILANPPYIRSDEIDRLAPEVALYEPRRALDGGADGLRPYAHLAAETKRLLKPGGTAIFEIGVHQATPVKKLIRDAQLQLAGVRRDLAGIERCVIVTTL